jgi:hypothetical protein
LTLSQAADANADNLVDFKEWILALNVLAHGSHEERIKCTPSLTCSHRYRQVQAS